MRTATVVLLALLALLLVAPALDPTASAADTCVTCHAGGGTYTFVPLKAVIATPKVVPPGQFNHTVEVHHPGHYTAYDTTVSVDVSHAPGVKLTGPSIVRLGDLPSGVWTATFAMVANATDAPQTVATTLTYTAFAHGTSVPYLKTYTVSLTVAEALLTPSTWRVDLAPGQSADLTFTAAREVRNLSLMASPVLDGVADVIGQGPSSMMPGDRFAVSLSGVSAGNGVVTVVYEDASGAPHELPVDVAVQVRAPTVAGPGHAARYFGMVFGFGSLTLLCVSAAIGMPFKPLKKRVNKLFSTGQVRTTFHCGVSWVLLVLAVLHAAVLMYTSWSSAMVSNVFLLASPGVSLGTFIDVGTVAWIAMLLVGLGGVLSRPITAWIGHRGWRYTHSLMTLTALVGSVLHSAVFTARLIPF